MRYSNYSVMETFNQYSFKYKWFVFCFSNTLEKKQQRADCNAWTWFLMVFNYYSWYCVNANQLPTPTFYYKIHSFNVPLQGVLCQLFEFTPPWYAKALCILCLRLNVHSSLAQGYCYNVFSISVQHIGY